VQRPKPRGKNLIFVLPSRNLQGINLSCLVASAIGCDVVAAFSSISQPSGHSSLMPHTNALLEKLTAEEEQRMESQ
jgi:hypothetical protein